MRIPRTHTEKREHWNDLIAQWEQSEMSQSAFCKQHGLSQSSFSKWKDKLRPRRKRTPNLQKASREEFWRRHVDDWSESKLPQTHYCKKNGLSKSAFSKWKLKFRPDWAHRSKAQKLKNKYGKYLKLSERQVEVLASLFFTRSHVASAAEILSLSRKTVYRYYKQFNQALFDGAAHYPQLFFGAGAILTLGPSPISRAIVNVDRKRVSPLNEAIMRYSSLRWSLEEIYLLLVTGIMLNYQYIFAPQNGLDPRGYNKETHRQLVKQKSYALIVAENWSYCSQNNLRYLWPVDSWLAVLHKRSYVADYKEKHKQMVRDFLWILRNNPLNSPAYFVDVNPYFRIMPNLDEIEPLKKHWEELAEKIKTGEVIFQAGN